MNHNLAKTDIQGEGRFVVQMEPALAQHWPSDSNYNHVSPIILLTITKIVD